MAPKQHTSVTYMLSSVACIVTYLLFAVFTDLEVVRLRSERAHCHPSAEHNINSSTAHESTNKAENNTDKIITHEPQHVDPEESAWFLANYYSVFIADGICLVILLGLAVYTWCVHHPKVSGQVGEKKQNKITCEIEQPGKKPSKSFLRCKKFYKCAAILLSWEFIACTIGNKLNIVFDVFYTLGGPMFSEECPLTETYKVCMCLAGVIYFTFILANRASITHTLIRNKEQHRSFVDETLITGFSLDIVDSMEFLSAIEELKIETRDISLYRAMICIIAFGLFLPIVGIFFANGGEVLVAKLRRRIGCCPNVEFHPSLRSRTFLKFLLTSTMNFCMMAVRITTWVRYQHSQTAFLAKNILVLITTVVTVFVLQHEEHEQEAEDDVMLEKTNNESQSNFDAVTTLTDETSRNTSFQESSDNIEHETVHNSASNA